MLEQTVGMETTGAMVDAIHTIGHSTHSIEKFVGLLRGAAITAVADVRSRPYSRRNPQFNRENLDRLLRADAIEYIFLGAELGARSADRSCYRNGQVQYDLLAETELFQQGIERVKEEAGSFRVALMCAEKEPLDCHRTILVARRLAEEGFEIRHILADGGIEDHERAIARLIERLGIAPSDMFRSRVGVVAEAYARQAAAIAYRGDVP